MSVINTILVIIGLMFLFVVYKNKDQPFSASLYAEQFKALLLTFFAYMSDVGTYAVVRFKKIDFQ